MDNPQKRPILSLEFVAGLIVGEGSYWITIARSKKKETLEFRPGFSLRMNDLETIDLVQEAFSAYGLSLYRRGDYLYDKGRGKPTAQIMVTGLQRMKTHLDVFLPLLTGTKKEAAEVVSAFVDKRLAEGGTWATRYDDEDISYIERLRAINGPSAARLDIGILRDHTRRPPKKLGRKPGFTPWNKGLRSARDDPISRRKRERLAEMTSPLF